MADDNVLVAETESDRFAAKDTTGVRCVMFADTLPCGDIKDVCRDEAVDVLTSLNTITVLELFGLTNEEDAAEIFEE